MKKSILEFHPLSKVIVCATMITISSFCGTSRVLANFTDPGFDAPFTTADFVPYAGTGLTAVNRWAAENADVVGTDNGVTPVSAAQMVRMNDDGSPFTELKQRLDGFSPLSNAEIDAGFGLTYFFACFNSPANAPAGMTANLLLQFLDGSLAPIGLPVSLSSGPMDNDPATWEHVEMVNVPIPAGARGVEAIIQHDNASLTGPLGFVAGYVDKTGIFFSSSVPEPGSLLLALLSAAFLPWRKHCRN